MAQNTATRLIEEKEHYHKIAKLWVWIVWISTMLVAAAYCVISILSFEHVFSVYNSDDDLVDDHELWAFLGATIIAPAMVIGFYFFGTMVLLKKTISEDGMSYSYGALHFSTIWMSMLVLQAGVSIHAYKDRMKVWEETTFDAERVDNWDGGKTTQAQVTYVLAYVLSLTFFCLFFFLFFFRSAAKRLIIDPKLKKREEDEQRAMEEQALLRAQYEQQQKAGSVAAAPADAKGKKPAESAGSEIKPDAAVKVDDKKPAAPAPDAKKPAPVPVVVKADKPEEAKPEEAKPEEKKPEEKKPEEKKTGGWFSRKPKPAAEPKDSAAVV
eukprot:jgi/Ulvmu1/6129/UM027_0107.1